MSYELANRRTAAARTNDQQRGRPRQGVVGRTGLGQRAKWIDYWGTIDEHVVGIAIFDHPSNPRHPTTWMVRGYGLVGANPFGLHDYLGEPEGSGDMRIKSGESVTFHYRFLFHEGDYEQAKIAQSYAAWTERDGN